MAVLTGICTEPLHEQGQPLLQIHPGGEPGELLQGASIGAGLQYVPGLQREKLQNRLAPQQTLQNGDVIDQLYRALAANVADPPGRVAGRSTAIPGQAPGRCLVQQPGDGFDYVIDAGEIPPVTAVIEQPRSEEHTSELQSRPHLVC